MIEKHKSRRIRAALRQALMADWDPIGVKDEPMAADEYDRHMAEVFLMLQRNATASEFEEYLLWVETARMGLLKEDGSPLRANEPRQRAVRNVQKVFQEQMLID